MNTYYLYRFRLVNPRLCQPRLTRAHAVVATSWRAAWEQLRVITNEPATKVGCYVWPTWPDAIEHFGF